MNWVTLDRIQWVATATTVASGLLSAFNFIPVNFLFSLISCCAWVWASVLMENKQILTMNCVFIPLMTLAIFNFYH